MAMRYIDLLPRVAAAALLVILLAAPACARPEPTIPSPIATPNTTPALVPAPDTTPVPPPTTPEPIPTPNVTPVPTPPPPAPEPVPTPNTTTLAPTPPPPPEPAPTPTPNTTPASGITYARDIQGIFNRNCLICHKTGAASGGLNLDPGTSYKGLINIKSQNTTFGALYLVAPGLPDESYLFLTLKGTASAPGHGAYPLPQEQLDLIKQWILDGALNN